jgi:hypothetical protein
MTPRTPSRLLLTAAAAALFSLAAAPAPARAQEVTKAAGGCDEENTDDTGSFRKIVRDGEVIYEYTGVVRVCGKVPKPNVVAILLEKTIEYEWESLKKDFLPKIQDSVKKVPF